MGDKTPMMIGAIGMLVCINICLSSSVFGSTGKMVTDEIKKIEDEKKDKFDNIGEKIEPYSNIRKNNNMCPKCMRPRKRKTIKYKQHEFLLK
jgi:hypothetical protein